MRSKFDHYLYKRGSLQLNGYVDTDWVGSPKDRSSMSDFCVYLGANPIFWSAEKQTMIARSSTEAEYGCLAQIAAEICWI